MSTVPTTTKCRPLPEDIRRIVRSGIVIASVSQCVEELVLNSIDAGAENVYVNVNFDSFSLEIEDDGCGISKDDLEIVGARFTTSKCNTFADLSNMKFYGFRGESLASLIDASSSVNITSKSVENKGEHLVYLKSFKNDTTVKPTADLMRHGKGTLVRIENVLSYYPVRQRRINKALQLEETKKILEYICLINPRLSLTLMNGADSNIILSVQAKNSVKDSFGEIFCKTSELIRHSRTMIEEHHQFSSFFFAACISSEMYNSKDLQIVFINKRYICRGKIHRNLHRLISDVLEGKRKKKTEKHNPVGLESGFPFPSESKKFPVFVVNIVCPFNEYDIIMHSQKSDVEFCNWESVLKGCEGLALRFKAIVQSLSKFPGKDRILHDAFPMVQSTLEADADGIGAKITTHDVRRALHSKVAVRQDNSVKTNATYTKQDATLENKDSAKDALSTNIPPTSQAAKESPTMLKLVRCRPVGITNLKRHQVNKYHIVGKKIKLALNPNPSPKLTGHIISGFAAFHSSQKETGPPLKKTNGENLPNNWQVSQEWSNHLQSLSVSNDVEVPDASKNDQCNLEQITKNILSPKLSPVSRSIWKVHLWNNNNLAAKPPRSDFNRDRDALSQDSDSDVNNNSNTTPGDECFDEEYFQTANREIENALNMIGNPDSRIKIKEDCRNILTSSTSGLATWDSIKNLRTN